MNPTDLVGRRFACDFRVERLLDGGRTAVLVYEPSGNHYHLSVAELLTVVERGFVMEVWPRRTP